MNRPSLLLRWLVVLLALALVPVAQAARPLPISVDPSSGVEVKALCPYDTSPLVGFVPLKITIQNSTNRARQWKVTAADVAQLASGVGYRLTFEENIEVPASSQRVFELMIPLASKAPRGYFNPVQITVSGYGINPSPFQMSAAYGRGSEATAFILMSTDVGLRTWEPVKTTLETATSSPSKNLLGSIVAPADLPSDWRAYLGVYQLHISEKEWIEVPESARNAIRQWLVRGGKLFLYSLNPASFSDRDFKTFELGSDGALVAKVGLGSVTLGSWNGKELDAPTTAKIIERQTYPLEEALHSGYLNNWSLRMYFGNATMVRS